MDPLLPSQCSRHQPTILTIAGKCRLGRSAISSIHIANGGTCDNGSVPSSSPGNYMYVCSVNYDSLSHQMEFANCLTAEVGTDPTISHATPTFGSCTAGHGGGLSGVSAGYQAEDLFG